MPPTAPSLHLGLHLAEILAARLCHDLASPLGALAGMIELAEETGDKATLAEARMASAHLARQLRLARAAWAIDPSPLTVATLEDLAEGLRAHRRITLNLSGLARRPDFTAEAGRVALNMLLLGAEAAGTDGTLHLSGAPAQDVVLRIAGPRAKWPAGMLACLLDPAAAWERMGDPRDVQMPLTVLLAARAGYQLSLLMPLTAEAGAIPPLLLRFG